MDFFEYNKICVDICLNGIYKEYKICVNNCFSGYYRYELYCVKMCFIDNFIKCEGFKYY